MYRKLRIIYFTLFLILPFLLSPKISLAQESIQSYQVDLTARKDGSMSINESIDYDFGSNSRHGIFRNIPLVSKVGDLFRVIGINFESIKRDGKDEQFSISSSATKTSLKIGDPDRTITGSHSFEINYIVRNGIGSNYSDHDEIFWNVTGNEWNVPIEKATYIIKTDFGVTPGQTICFTGSLGSKGKNCEVRDIEGGKRVTLTKGLNPYEGLSVVSSFPVNTFPKSNLEKTEPFLDPDFKTFLKIIIPIYLLLNFILAPYLIFWYKNKAKIKLGNPSVNFDLPKFNKQRITPSEAGTIDNTKLDKDDITATIFDLAIRKYIKIEQVKKVKKLMPDEIDHKLIKLKDFSDLNDLEKSLMEKIFDYKDEVLVKDIKLDYSDFQSFEKKNFNSLISRGFYTKNPKEQMAFLLVIGIIATAFLNLILGPVLIWLSRKLNGRTKIGDQVDLQVDGLKIFLKNMKRYYKWQADSGYFVEKYIPYALALGFLDEYMKQLEILNPKYSPSFYSGSNFYTNYYLLNSTFSSNITTTAPSSSSGFSGGGFSGGGGGGGGGGSW